MFRNQEKMFGVYFHRNLEHNTNMDSAYSNFKTMKKGQKETLNCKSEHMTKIIAGTVRWLSGKLKVLAEIFG